MEIKQNLKHSGKDWIGYIPNNWAVKKVKYVFKTISGATPDSNNLKFWDGDITWITPADMNESKIIAEGERKISKSGYMSCGTTIVPKGSIIISNRAPIGKIKITAKDLCTNQGCKALVKYTDSFNATYFYYFLIIQKDTLNMLGRGTTFMELSTNDLKNFVLPVPLEEEQQRIAEFLDNEIGKVDNIISDMEKQVGILMDYKKAVITETVTKGLKYNVKMKDSGVDWIGEIPEKWCIKPIKYFADFFNGDRGNNYPTNSELVEEGIAFINAGHIIDGKLCMDSMDYITEKKYKSLGGLKIKKNDLVYCLRGSIGKNAIVHFDRGTVNSCMVGIRSKELNPKYYYYCMNSDVEEMYRKVMSSGSVQAQMSAETVKVFKMPVPSNSEQQEIADYLDEKCSNIEVIIEKKKEAIETMKEYRKSLIYEYVTGKKRVLM